MPDGKATPLEPGLIARVAQGLRYIVSSVTPETFFGPDQPLPPLAQGSAGRQFDYPVGYYLRTRPREDEALGFRDLRALADAYDLLRLVIETRKDQVARLRWTIRPRDEYAPDPADPRILALRRFFHRPDREHGWSTWLRLLLEDMLVLDAPCLFRRKALDGSPFAFEIMDGALIKRVIDARGRTPLPPDPAYQQILKGLPAVDYTTGELLYLPRNPRPEPALRLFAGCSRS